MQKSKKSVPQKQGEKNIEKYSQMPVQIKED
jgi:hypothetical protein